MGFRTLRASRKHVSHTGLAEQTVHGVISAPSISDEHARENRSKNLNDDGRSPIGRGVIVGRCFISERPKPPIDSANAPAGLISPDVETLADIPKDFFRDGF